MERGQVRGDSQRILEEAIEQLENVASIPPKQRHTNVADLAKSIASAAYEAGLPTPLLNRLLTTITKSKHLDQTTITTLIKNLYPSTRIPPHTVSKIISSFGPSHTTKPSPATQSLLLRWLILVYEDMEDQSHLSRLYAVLFDYLDMISLRRSLCHLLSLITRRKHIKPFRIQALMNLIRNTGGEEKELLGLLKVFKSYYPDIIVGDAYATTGTRAAYFFKHPDPEWVKHMRHLQEKASSAAVAGVEDGAHAPQTFQAVRRGEVKRSRIEVVIPVVQTSRVRRDYTSLEELRSASDFVKRLDKIELPNQIAAALGDPLAQRYLVLVRQRGARGRLESWLESFFEDEMDRLLEGGDEEGEGEYLGFVLEALVGFVRFTKEMPRAVDKFLRNYLPLWNGRDNRNAILGLLEYIPIQDYDTLHQNYFIPLENSILNGQSQSKILLLQYYSTLIQHWGTIIRATPSPTPLPPLPQVIARAELLALTILESPLPTRLNETIQVRAGIAPVLQFYTNLAALFRHAPTNLNIRITVPPPQTIYTLAFTPTLTSISTLCSILASYKYAFETSLTSTTLQSQDSPNRLYSTEMVARFNGYVMDICNLIWRNRGLTSDDPNALGCLVPAETVKELTRYVQGLDRRVGQDDAGKHKYQLSSVFSLSQNVALCQISSACFQMIEEEAEKGGKSLSARLTRPVTQKALAALDNDGGVRINWQEYRLRMLEWLDELGAEGVGNIMRSTMKALRK
ncbi:hypothetical protein FQN50_006853 [Emmonsiellopsis sp. PD_5]|nr:hypothetical protein FQN50_006853 [Emmonsiellopsis sp. PD_5]